MMSRKTNPRIGVPSSEQSLGLPPGFRFHPTDEELVGYYLTQKVLGGAFELPVIEEVDFNKCEPWDLPARTKIGENTFYFFSVRDKKYPTGMRTNRATKAGYWKATGKDREIVNSGRLMGMKKTLVFYTGRAPKGEKTNWIMHEYRLEGDAMAVVAPDQQGWVVCRVFDKGSHADGKMGPAKESSDLVRGNVHSSASSSFGPSDQVRSSGSLPPLLTMDPPSPSSTRPNYISDREEMNVAPSEIKGYNNQSFGRPTSSAEMVQKSSYGEPQNSVHSQFQLPGTPRREYHGITDSLENFISTWDNDSLDWSWANLSSGGQAP